MDWNRPRSAGILPVFLICKIRHAGSAAKEAIAATKHATCMAVKKIGCIKSREEVSPIATSSCPAGYFDADSAKAGSGQPHKLTLAATLCKPKFDILGQPLGLARAGHSANPLLSLGMRRLSDS